MRKENQKNKDYLVSEEAFYVIDNFSILNMRKENKKNKAYLVSEEAFYRVFELDLSQIKCLLGHQKCTFKS
jgi:hypothetical protein